MIDLLARLSFPSEIHEVKQEDVGFSIIAKPECVDEFSIMVREAVNCPNPPFVLFTTPIVGIPDRAYERAHVLPL